MTLKCPSCDSQNVTTVWTMHTFQYGAVNPVSLTTRVPVKRCGCCRETWLDYTSEAIMDKVIKDFEEWFKEEDYPDSASYQDGL